MSDHGNWVWVKRQIRRHEAAKITCYKCGRKDRQGLIDGLCVPCFCSKMDDGKPSPSPAQ